MLLLKFEQSIIYEYKNEADAEPSPAYIHFLVKSFISGKTSTEKVKFLNGQ